MKETIATRLRKLREKLGLSQDTFGALADIPHHQISKYERGEISPSSEILIKLSTAHHVDIHWLLTGDGDMLNKRDKDISEPVSKITSADSLTNIASAIHSAYNKVKFTGCATTQWILNLIQSLNILVEIRKTAPHKRKFWRPTSNNVEDLSNYLRAHFPGDQNLSVEARIQTAMDELTSKKRIDAMFAMNISMCFEVASREFAFLEYANKYTIPTKKFAQIRSLLEPWCYWVARAAGRQCAPLEVDPDLLIRISAKDKPKIVELHERNNNVEVRTLAGSVSFSFLRHHGGFDCSASVFNDLLQAVETLRGKRTEFILYQEAIEKPSKYGRVETSGWIIDKKFNQVRNKKDTTFLSLNTEEFNQFIDLVEHIWTLDAFRTAIVIEVVKECGAL